MDLSSQLKDACDVGDVKKSERVLIASQSKEGLSSLLHSIINPPGNHEILSFIFTFIEKHKAELLQVAATLGMAKLITIGVEKRGWDIHSEYNGKQPIHAAVESGREVEVRYLLERGSNPNADSKALKTNLLTTHFILHAGRKETSK